MWFLGYDLWRTNFLSPFVVAVEMYSAAEVVTEPAVWGNLLYHMFTEDHVLSPAQIDAICFCDNVLNLWALSSSQRVMSLNQETLPKIHFKLFEV